MSEQDGICETCGEPLELDPIYGKVYASCGDCEGGREPDGEAFRGGEAEAFARAEMDEIFRTLK